MSAILNAPTIIGITVTLVFYSFFLEILRQVEVFVNLSTYHVFFTLGNGKVPKITSSFLITFLINTWSCFWAGFGDLFAF